MKDQLKYQKSKEKDSGHSNNNSSDLFSQIFLPDKRDLFSKIIPNNKNPPSNPNNNGNILGGIDFSNINEVIKNCRNIKFQGLLESDDLLLFNKRNDFKSGNQSYLINLEDLAVFLKILYDPSITYKNISFSLDPYEPTNPNGPFMRKVFYPDELEKRQILQGTKIGEDMFLADYLMKQMVLGYVDNSNTKFNYPNNLFKKGLKPVHLLPGSNGNLRSRHWVVTRQIETIKRKSGLFYINGIKLGVDARELEISKNGTLVDKKIQNLDLPCYKFAEIFSNLYDEIGKYYKIFDRLKEITGALALAKYIYDNHYPIDYSIVEKIYESTLIPNYKCKIDSIYHYDKKYTGDGFYTHYIFGGIDLWSGMIENEKNILNELNNSFLINNNNDFDTEIITIKNNKLNIDLSNCNVFEFPFLTKVKKCSICNADLNLSELKINEAFKNRYKSTNTLYCNKHNPFNCPLCQNIITDSYFFSNDGINYHKQCLKCIYCSKNFFDNELCKCDEGFIHKKCFEDLNNDIIEKEKRYLYDNSPDCEFCEEKITDNYQIINNYNIHSECFEKIKKKGIDPGKSYILEGLESKCYICKKIIFGECKRTIDGLCHLECLSFIVFIIYSCYLMRIRNKVFGF